MTKDNTTDREKSRFAAEMVESFGDLRDLGLIEEATHERTLRVLQRDESEPVIVHPLREAKQSKAGSSD